jgi:hypothetical protein
MKFFSILFVSISAVSVSAVEAEGVSALSMLILLGISLFANYLLTV